MFADAGISAVLSGEALDAVHEHAMTILEEIGTDVRHDGALALLAGLGQDIDGERVRWDREFVMEMAERAPPSFTLAARNPERSVKIGGGKPVLTPVGGSPFCSDLERGRREGTISDYVELIKMAHAAPLMTCQQSGTVEAQDLDERTRHMDMDYAVLRWSDKPLICYGTSGPKARDAVDLAADRARRARGDRGEPGDHGRRQPQQPAGVGRADGRRAHGVGGRGPAGGRDPVPARRRDRAGQHRRRACPAGGRGAVGRGARPGRPARRPVPVRVVLHRRRHAHRRAGASARRSRSSARSPAASSPAATSSRTAAAAASARRTRSTSRPRPRRPSRCGRR